jgi:hypothetical protein
MLRTLVEIVSFSKIDKVADQKLVYRAFADVTSLGDFYPGQPHKKVNKIRRQ